MDVEVAAGLDSEQKFWAELDESLTAPCETHELIDDALRYFLSLTTTAKQEYLDSEYDIARCCYKLLDSNLFLENQNYVRRQILYCLLQEEDAAVLHFAAAILLYDGRSRETGFELLQAEGAFPRLVDLIRDKRDDDIGLHRLALELVYEMARIQRLSRDDLVTVDDTFVLYLFQLTEQLADDADDPYHYPVIRVLLVLNEQYMCLASSPTSPTSPNEGPVTNRILKLLSSHGPFYRTFGENLILLLNRETALSPQLLILKLLYLLFTTPSTYEYFYTNDLHVLVDVIIRNLLDLDPGINESGLAADGTERDGQRALRHTYLRVLCPLLKNSQLAREESNYKRQEVRKLMYLLVNRSSAHFAPVDGTVIRLVIRIRQIEWIREEGDEEDEELERKLAEVAPDETQVAKKILGMSMEGESSLSVVEMSAKVTKEKPMVPAPRRGRKKNANGDGAHSNGSHGNELKVPSVSRPNSVTQEARSGGHSPFADDNERA